MNQVDPFSGWRPGDPLPPKTPMQDDPSAPPYDPPAETQTATQPDPATAAVNDAVGGGMLPSGNEPGERDVDIRTPGGTGSVAETQEVIDAVDAPITNAEGDVFVDTSAADQLVADQAEEDRLAAERDRLAAEQAEADRLAAEQAAANATSAEQAAAAQAELDRIAAEQAAAAQAQAEADRIAAEEAAALANMDATVNQTTTDWWSQWGYTTQQEAIDSTKFKQITGPDGVVTWVPKGPPGGEPGEKELEITDGTVDPATGFVWFRDKYIQPEGTAGLIWDTASQTWNAPADNSTTTGWWVGHGYTTEQDAIDSGLFAQDPTTGVWGLKPAIDDNQTTTGWWTEHNFPDEATAIASGLFQQDPTTGAWTLIPTGDTGTTTGWWTGHGYTTEQEAIASGLFQQDATGAWTLIPATGGDGSGGDGSGGDGSGGDGSGGDGSGTDTSQDYLNYVLDGSAMGYNPYMSGQYQSNPYGNAGVPNLGGITSIPIPAPLQNFEPPQDQPSAMELFNAGYNTGYKSPRTTTST
jgi:hypothetical protein